MMAKATRWLGYLLQVPLYWLSRWIPPRKQLWIFGAWQGTQYADNSRYLYEYIRQHRPEVIAVWFTANSHVAQHLRAKGHRVVRANTLKALWYALRARVAVVTHSVRTDLQPVVHPAKTITVQLWHGIPLKKIGYDDTRFTHPPRHGWRKLLETLRTTLFPFWKERYHLIITTSRQLVPVFASAFRHPPTTVQVTGYPRNDALFHPTAPSPVPRGERAVIYLPTFRGAMGSSPDLFTPYGFDLKALEALLYQYKAHFFLKLHPVNRPPEHLQDAINQSQRVHFLAVDDIHSILAHFDVLITDYSSIYFDFLLLDRPIIFAPFDHEHYTAVDREFYFEYSQVTPGPHARNWPEVFQALEALFRGEDAYATQRQQIRNQFHEYQDDRSAERVARAIDRCH